MKIENTISGISAGNNFTINSSGSVSAVFCAGSREAVQIGRMKIGGFDEAQGLPEKLRRHAADDGLSVEADSSNVIPFGCEYHVKRHWKIAGGICELTCDVAADHGGAVTDLELEKITLPIANAKVEFLIYGEKEFRTAAEYSGSEMLVMLRASGANGEQAELYFGDDFWRHRAAATIAGATAQFTLETTENAVVYSRKVLKLDPETVPEKRPWRFKTLIAVSTAGTPFPAAAATALPGCFAAPATGRRFKEAVRKSGSDKFLCFTGDFPHICSDGSHLSRPGRELAHGDLAEVFNAWLWASGTLAKRQGGCAMRTQNTLFAASVIVRNMGSAMQKTLFGDEI